MRCAVNGLAPIPNIFSEGLFVGDLGRQLPSNNRSSVSLKRSLAGALPPRSLRQ